MARVQRKEVKREAISIHLTTEAKNEVLFEMKCHNFTSYSAYFEHLREVHNASPIDAADKTAYTDMASLLTGTEAAETAAGVGGSASKDEGEDTWSAKYSCSLGEDTFTVTITREYMLVNGFEEDETLAAVESWADTIPALGGTA
jgi:hypothetical protein